MPNVLDYAPRKVRRRWGGCVLFATPGAVIVSLRMFYLSVADLVAQSQYPSDVLPYAKLRLDFGRPLRCRHAPVRGGHGNIPRCDISAGNGAEVAPLAPRARSRMAYPFRLQLADSPLGGIDAHIQRLIGQTAAQEIIARTFPAQTYGTPTSAPQCPRR